MELTLGCGSYIRQRQRGGVVAMWRSMENEQANRLSRMRLGSGQYGIDSGLWLLSYIPQLFSIPGIIPGIEAWRCYFGELACSANVYLVQVIPLTVVPKRSGHFPFLHVAAYTELSGGVCRFLLWRRWRQASFLCGGLPKAQNT